MRLATPALQLASAPAERHRPNAHRSEQTSRRRTAASKLRDGRRCGRWPRDSALHSGGAEKCSCGSDLHRPHRTAVGADHRRAVSDVSRDFSGERDLDRETRDERKRKAGMSSPLRGRKAAALDAAGAVLGGYGPVEECRQPERRSTAESAQPRTHLQLSPGNFRNRPSGETRARPRATPVTMEAGGGALVAKGNAGAAGLPPEDLSCGYHQGGRMRIRPHSLASDRCRA
jgi:hypothetical protein